MNRLISYSLICLTLAPAAYADAPPHPQPAAAAVSTFIPMGDDEALTLLRRTYQRYYELISGVQDRAGADAAAAEVATSRFLIANLSMLTAQRSPSRKPSAVADTAEALARAREAYQRILDQKFYGSRLLCAAMRPRQISELPAPTAEEKVEAVRTFEREQQRARVLLSTVTDKASADAAALEYACAQAHVNLLAMSGYYEGSYSTVLIDFQKEAAADVERLLAERFYGSSLLSEMLTPHASPVQQVQLPPPTAPKR